MSKKHKSERLVEILTTNHVPLRVVLVRLTDYEEEVGKFVRGVRYEHKITLSDNSHLNRDQFEVIYEGEKSRYPYFLRLNSIVDLIKPKVFAPRDYRELLLGSRHIYDGFFRELNSDKAQNRITDAAYLYILNKVNELYAMMMSRVNMLKMMSEEKKVLHKPQAPFRIKMDDRSELGGVLEDKTSTNVVFGRQTRVMGSNSKRIIEEYKTILYQDKSILPYLKRAQ